MDCLEALVITGLTRQEAQFYLLLSTNGPLSGYEAAKLTGVSRSNAYASLNSLVEKGACLQVHGKVVQYDALPAAEYTANVRRRTEAALLKLEKEVPRHLQKPEPYFTLSRADHIIDKMKNMLARARERIYLSIASDVLDVIREDIIQAAQNRVRVVLLTDAPEPVPGAEHYLRTKASGQIRLIADTEAVLTGELGQNPTCMFSQNSSLVRLVYDSIAYELALAKTDNK